MEKLNVAVADDNERMVEVLGKIIEEDKDLELVGKAHNGEEICNIIREKEPDVVVLDIIMPKMDGLAVMERFVHDSSLKKIPAFIVVSAVGKERITEDAFSLAVKSDQACEKLRRQEIQTDQQTDRSKRRKYHDPGKSGDRCNEHHS